MGLDKIMKTFIVSQQKIILQTLTKLDSLNDRHLYKSSCDSYHFWTR